MRKTTKKKLVLAKETVRTLDDVADVRGGAAGGGSYEPTQTSCTMYFCPNRPAGTE